MCLILHQRPGYTLPRQQLATIIARNGDGFGAMWGDGKRLHLARMVGTAAEIMGAYAMHQGKGRVLHWRLGTHGRVDLSQAHPFRLSEEVAVMHNGVLSCGTPDAGESDTAHLARYILAPVAERDPNLLFCPRFGEVLAGLIGAGNKLAFAHADGRVAIVGRARGVDWAGCWWSNTYAWDAPAAVSGTGGRHRMGTHYSARYGTGHGTGHGASGWGWEDDDGWTPSTAARTVTRAPEPAPAEVPPAAAVWRAHLVGGDAAVTQWATKHPDAAAVLLAAAFDVSAAEARQLVTEHPGTAAPWLVEAAEGQRTLALG